MTAVVSTHVLIDACVARNVGENSTLSELLAVKNVLQELDSGSVGLLVTPRLVDEWRKHSTRFMTRWLVSMQSRGRVVSRTDRPVRDFRLAVKTEISDDQGKAAVLKDAHLTEAAILCNAGVLSTDAKQKVLLAKVARSYERLAIVQWLHPGEESSAVIVWLQGTCVDRSVGCIGIASE